eukprot:TRINITY_DN4709_c0_g1_i1.p1 TRINITY_DN4709_c0_g1~~TRINITY_DN4709_c0_g1_i1.p1  ORF type:complete len:104 (+),score=4.01 TRINITY_DN4709_c0_g1_i1:244-555(+)
MPRPISYAVFCLKKKNRPHLGLFVLAHALKANSGRLRTGSLGHRIAQSCRPTRSLSTVNRATRSGPFPTVGFWHGRLCICFVRTRHTLEANQNEMARHLLYAV